MITNLLKNLEIPETLDEFSPQGEALLFGSRRQNPAVALCVVMH